MFYWFQLFIFTCGFSAKVTCVHFLLLRVPMEKLTELKTLRGRVRKTTLSSIFIIRLRFQEYHSKSGIDLFCTKLYLQSINYTYSPLITLTVQ